jgi:hypothetical protein
VLPRSSTLASAPWPPPRLPDLDSELSAHKLLSELGCDQEFMAIVTRLFFHPITFIFVVVALTIAALIGDLKLAKRNLQLNLGSRVVAVSILLAVFQWHSSLEQDAMQRYEMEISNASNAETSSEVATMLPRLYDGCGKADYDRDHFVYIHLDNLEYALERYREGFASATTTTRAIMTFAVHCRENDFKRRALQQLWGYSPLVQRVAKAVIARV